MIITISFPISSFPMAQNYRNQMLSQKGHCSTCNIWLFGRPYRKLQSCISASHMGRLLVGCFIFFDVIFLWFTYNSEELMHLYSILNKVLYKCLIWSLDISFYFLLYVLYFNSWLYCCSESAWMILACIVQPFSPDLKLNIRLLAMQNKV